MKNPVFTMNEKETPGEFVIRRLQEAATTLHRLPSKGYRQTFSRYWPETVSDKFEAADKQRDKQIHGKWIQTGVMQQDTLPSWASPSPRAIDEMDATLNWLFLLENEQTRRVVARRSVVNRHTLKTIYSWERIAEWVECGSAHNAHVLFDCGIKNIAKRLTFAKPQLAAQR